MLNSQTRSCGGFDANGNPTELPTRRQLKAALSFWHERVINNLSNSVFSELFWISATQLLNCADDTNYCNPQLILPMREPQTEGFN